MEPSGSTTGEFEENWRFLEVVLKSRSSGRHQIPRTIRALFVDGCETVLWELLAEEEAIVVLFGNKIIIKCNSQTLFFYVNKYS